MPSLHPAFESVRSFEDFRDAYAAQMNVDMAPRMTRNDLVRAWNILYYVSSLNSNYFSMRYEEVNISQSSVRTIVSKLNQLFRFVGLIEHWHSMKIEQTSFSVCTINIQHLNTTNVLEWDLCVINPGGRRQDRTSDRHQNGHRVRRAAVNGSQSIFDSLADINAMLDGFDGFEGVESSTFLTLEAEAC